MQKSRIDTAQILSPDDIRVLLNNPNSWLHKLYQECLQLVSIEQFIQYMHVLSEMATVDRELAKHYVSENETDTDSMQVDDEDELRVSSVTDAPSTGSSTTKPVIIESFTDKQARVQKQLSNELTTLLAQDLSEIKTDLSKLEAFHQKVTSNLNSQIAVQLGPEITLTNPKTNAELKLVVPQPVMSVPVAGVPKSSFLRPLASSGASDTELLPPAPSIRKILKHNPDLLKSVKADEESQFAFALTHTKANIGGPFMVFSNYQAILKANKMTDLDSGFRIALLKELDKTTSMAIKNHSTVTEVMTLYAEAALSLIELRSDNSMRP